MKRRLLTTLVLAVGLLSQSSPTLAQVTTQDLQVAGRALGFLAKPLTGEVSVGIVYAKDSAQSASEAHNLEKLLSGGLRVGNLTLKAVLVPAADVSHAHVDLLFLAPALGDEAKAAAEVSRTAHIPCVTTDLSQVRSGYCALGIRSQPQIEILVNRAAAAASGTTFSTAFRVMITEI